MGEVPKSKKAIFVVSLFHSIHTCLLDLMLQNSAHDRFNILI